MVRETARSKVIGYSYHDFSSPPNMGTHFLATTKPPFAKSWSVSADTLESMCGRYATASPQDLMEEFEVDDLFDGLPGRITTWRQLSRCRLSSSGVRTQARFGAGWLH